MWLLFLTKERKDFGWSVRGQTPAGRHSHVNQGTLFGHCGAQSLHNQGLTFPLPEATRRLKGILVQPTPCSDGPLFTAQKEEVLCSGQQAGAQGRPSDHPSGQDTQSNISCTQRSLTLGRKIMDTEVVHFFTTFPRTKSKAVSGNEKTLGQGCKSECSEGPMNDRCQWEQVVSSP